MDEHRTGRKLPDGSWEPAPYSSWSDANPPDDEGGEEEMELRDMDTAQHSTPGGQRKEESMLVYIYVDDDGTILGVGCHCHNQGRWSCSWRSIKAIEEGKGVAYMNDEAIAAIVDAQE